MDNKFSMVMNYFIEYETRDRLNNVSIKNIDGITIPLNKFNDVEYIKRYLNSKKKSFIKKEIKDFIKDAKNLENISNEVLNLEKKTKENLKLSIIEILNNYYNKTNSLINVKINQIVDVLFNDVITVLYPIYQVAGKRLPLIASYCKISSDKLCVEKYEISEDLLNNLMMNNKKITLEEYFGGKKIMEEFFQALNSMDNADINELKYLILEELKCKIPDLRDEICNNEWKQAIITIDELKEINFSPFKEEITLLKSVYKDNETSIIEKYIFPQKDRKHIDELKLDSHFGSYTNDYSVNEKQWKVVNSVRKNQLISVTGPPGTGKTTVLKEIIADSFVEKTKKIIELWSSEWKEINVNNIKIFQSPLIGSNFKSIIVTSTNNEAVDNIGQEIGSEIEYLINKNDKDDTSGFCARLGKKLNMDTFNNSVLKKKIEMLREYENAGIDGSRQLIEEFNKVYGEIDSFNKIASAYIDIKKELMSKYDFEIEDVSYEFILKETKELDNYIYNLNNQLNILKNEIIAYDDSIENLIKNNREDEVELSKAKIDEVCLIAKLKKYNKIIKFKIVGKLIAKIIYGDINIINQRLDNVKFRSTDLISDVEHRKNRINELKAFQEEKKIRVENIEDELDKIELKVKNYKIYLNKHDGFIKELNNLEIDICPDEPEFNIYNNKTILNKRNLLFNISLRINEMYIFNNRDKILNNLEYVYQDSKWFKKFYSSDFRYNADKEKNIRLVWETFCLCFPVITTTLHSFEKSKFHMVKELFDTLLVDEAGQVLPYYLISPLYRVKNAVIVGDVLQLQPIRKNKIDIFNKYEDQLLPHLDADVSSAQHYSDMSSEVYELLKGKNSGIILEEHKRCERAIAAFSNQYVYDNRMKISKGNYEKEFLKNNVCFIDIRGEKNKNNTNDSEVRICKALVKELLDKYRPEDIGIITPYKNQKLKIIEEVDKGIVVGTVHAFQGKGKEVIIMSMVTSSVNDRAGIRFIGEEPNFLNVAFTRAKSQLIIIGNYELIDNVKGNYLENMNAFIKEYGRIYSIYHDNILDNVESKYRDQFYRVISYGNEITSSKYSMLFNDYIDAKGLIIDSNHYKLLLNLFNYAEKRVEVVSPWIKSTVIDHNFLNEIKKFIDNNKTYRIIFGYNKTQYTLNTKEQIGKIVDKDSTQKNKLADDIKIIKDLKDILRNDLIYRPPLHTKAIIIDNEYLIIGSHNWLSKQGQRSDAKQEVSCIIKDKGMIKFLMDKWK